MKPMQKMPNHTSCRLLLLLAAVALPAHAQLK
jgi:hypothetical protein